MLIIVSVNFYSKAANLQIKRFCRLPICGPDKPRNLQESVFSVTSFLLRRAGWRTDAVSVVHHKLQEGPVQEKTAREEEGPAETSIDDHT